MALPKLNDKPKYDLVIPSTGQKVRFRPFLVKEEKVLMLAMETKNDAAILNAVVDTIEACLDGKANVDKLTTFDVEYIFTKIRSKSVGEKANIVVKCSACNHNNDAVVDLDKLSVNVPDVNKIIPLTDKISLKMKWPTYKDTVDVELLNNSSQIDQTFNLITKCIESVMTEEENILLSDLSKQEVIEFIESFSSQQFKQIQQFVQKIPSLSTSVEFTCTNCNEHNHMTIRGMNNFFS